jgi:hypothetical protein
MGTSFLRFLLAVFAALSGVGAGSRTELLPVGLGREWSFALAAFLHADSIGHTPIPVKGSGLGLDTLPGMVYSLKRGETVKVQGVR